MEDTLNETYYISLSILVNQQNGYFSCNWQKNWFPIKFVMEDFLSLSMLLWQILMVGFIFNLEKATVD